MTSTNCPKLMTATALAVTCLLTPTTVLAGWSDHDISLDLPLLSAHETVSRLDGAGRPLLAASDAGSLHFARRVGDQWRTFLVDTRGAADLSLATNRHGYAFLSYRDNLSQELLVARPNGLGWTVESIDGSGRLGEYSSLAVDADGLPVASFQRGDELYIARRGENGWVTSLVEDGATDRLYSPLAVDAEGQALVAYHDADGDLELLRWDGSESSRELVAHSGDFGQAPALTLDRDGLPVIAFRDEDGELRVAVGGNDGFTLEAHDLVDNAGGELDVAFDVAGRLVVSESGNGHIQSGRSSGRPVLLSRTLSHITPGWQASTFPLTSRNADALRETSIPGATVDTSNSALTFYRLDASPDVMSERGLRAFKVTRGLAITY